MHFDLFYYFCCRRIFISNEGKLNIMFVLWLITVMYFSMVNAASNENTQKLLQMSLRQVNTLLADIDEKIATERKLLSELNNENDNGLPGNNKNTGQDSPKIDQNPGKSMFLQSQLTEFEPRYALQGPRQGVESLTLNTSNVSQTQGSLLDITRVAVLPEDPPGLPSDWPFEDGIPMELKSTTEMSVLKKVMIETMASKNVGYAYAALRGILKAIFDKTNRDVNVLLEACGQALLRMTEERKLYCLGPLLTLRLKKMWIWAFLLTANVVRKYSGGLAAVLSVKEMVDRELASLIYSYDSFFTIEEGSKMIHEVDEFGAYNVITHGKESAQKVLENMFESIMAPANRLCDTFALRTFINNANRIYASRYADTDVMRSGNYTLIDQLLGTEASLPSDGRRRMSKDVKNAPYKYRNVLRHFIVKHPRLFNEFVKHYKQSKKRKHFRFGKKKHRNHHKRYHHTRTSKPINYEMNSYLIDNSTWTMEYVKSTTPRISDYSEQISSTDSYNSTSQKRYSVVTETNTHEHGISPSILSRRIIYDYYENTGNPLIPVAESHNVHYGNKLLDKIMRESSYSDEESFLKTMLRYAFFHENDTIEESTQFHKAHDSVVKRRAAMITDGTDEELVLKNNIYNFFQQTPKLM